MLKEDTLTPQKAQKIQDEIFKKMSAEKKIKMTSSLYAFLKKLNKLNDRKKWK